MGNRWVESVLTFTGGDVKTISAADARRGMLIGNPSDTVMTVRFAGDADALTGLPLPAGQSMDLSGERAVSTLVTIFCAGSGKKATVYTR